MKIVCKSIENSNRLGYNMSIHSSAQHKWSVSRIQHDKVSHTSILIDQKQLRFLRLGHQTNPEWYNQPKLRNPPHIETKNWTGAYPSDIYSDLPQGMYRFTENKCQALQLIFTFPWPSHKKSHCCKSQCSIIGHSQHFMIEMNFNLFLPKHYYVLHFILLVCSRLVISVNKEGEEANSDIRWSSYITYQGLIINFQSSRCPSGFQ